MAIAVLGGNEFVVGFQLAGVKHIIEIDKETDAMETMNKIKNDSEINMVIVDEAVLNRLDRHDRLEIEASVRPVYVPLSSSSSQESLRYLIKKSIGVDILS